MYVHHQLRKIFNLAFSPRYLLTTNTVVGTLGIVGADPIKQYASHYVYTNPFEKTKEVESQAFVFDNKRAFGMASGGLIFGVAGHYWYQLLDRKFPGRSLTVVSKKLSVNNDIRDSDCRISTVGIYRKLSQNGATN